MSLYTQPVYNYQSNVIWQDMDFTKEHFIHSKNYFELIRTIRQFFNEKGFIDIPSPPMVEHPGLEAHLHPFQIMRAKDQGPMNYYLHTSPEFYLKEMLSLGFEKIFSLAHCHRDEPRSSHHLPQFMMLEWYRANERYEKIMDDTEELISHCYEKFNLKIPKFLRMTVDEIFEETLDFKISNFLNKENLIKKIKSIDSSLITNESLNWDDYFFLLFLNKIEPEFKKFPALILYEYPAPLAALSTLKNDHICERFEIFLDGLELANCFNELTDYEELLNRFKSENKSKQEQYNYSLPTPETFFETQKRLPKSAGIALGIDRLFMRIFDLEKITVPGNQYK